MTPAELDAKLDEALPCIAWNTCADRREMGEPRVPECLACTHRLAVRALIEDVAREQRASDEAHNFCDPKNWPLVTEEKKS
jgi:hypothetical protein